MTIHILKTVQPYFKQVSRGLKTFEVRKNDRDFREGDILLLCPWPTPSGHFEVLRREVTYILYSDLCSTFGVEPGYVVMGIRDVGPDYFSRKYVSIHAPELLGGSAP